MPPADAISAGYSRLLEVLYRPAGGWDIKGIALGKFDGNNKRHLYPTRSLNSVDGWFWRGSDARLWL